jgi:hypothetical protein
VNKFAPKMIAKRSKSIDVVNALVIAFSFGNI